MQFGSTYRAMTGLGIAMAAAAALAALPKEGNIDYTACWTGSANELVISKEHSVTTYELVGTIVSNAPGGYGDGSTFRCVGMNTVLKGRAGGSNLCQATDRDGDKTVSRFEIGADGSVVREFVSGTGKYEGAAVAIKVANLPPVKEARAGNLQACNHQTGTYKLK